jgi:hypothetical protein
MSLSRATLLIFCAVLAVIVVLGSARERGANAEVGMRTFAYGRTQTPALNNERPVRMVAQVADPAGSPESPDNVYLASPFAPTGRSWVAPPEAATATIPAAVARVQVDLPSGQHIDLRCPPGREAELCVTAVRRALGLDTEISELTAEAHPPSEP